MTAKNCSTFGVGRRASKVTLNITDKNAIYPFFLLRLFAAVDIFIIIIGVIIIIFGSAFLNVMCIPTGAVLRWAALCIHMAMHYKIHININVYPNIFAIRCKRGTFLCVIYRKQKTHKIIDWYICFCFCFCFCIACHFSFGLAVVLLLALEISQLL